MRISPIIILITLFLTGCAIGRPANRSRSIASEAHAAQMRGDWETSVRLWEQAIRIEKGIWKDPELSNSPRNVAIYYYELGRSLGVLGEYDAAERNLLQALRLDEKFDGPKGMDLVELARLNHARGDNARAASFFDSFISEMGEVSEQDPAGYFALLNEAAATYEAVGQTNQAALLKLKARTFSTNHAHLEFSDDYNWTPYKTNSVSEH